MLFEVDAVERKAFHFARQMINLISRTLLKMDRIRAHNVLDVQREHGKIRESDKMNTIFLSFTQSPFRNAFCFLNAENEH